MVWAAIQVPKRIDGQRESMLSEQSGFPSTERPTESRFKPCSSKKRRKLKHCSVGGLPLMPHKFADTRTIRPFTLVLRRRRRRACDVVRDVSSGIIILFVLLEVCQSGRGCLFSLAIFGLRSTRLGQHFHMIGRGGHSNRLNVSLHLHLPMFRPAGSATLREGSSSETSLNAMV